MLDHIAGTGDARSATMAADNHEPHSPRPRRRNGQPVWRPEAARWLRAQRRNHHGLLRLRRAPRRVREGGLRHPPRVRVRLPRGGGRQVREPCLRRICVPATGRPAAGVHGAVGAHEALGHDPRHLERPSGDRRAFRVDQRRRLLREDVVQGGGGASDAVTVVRKRGGLLHGRLPGAADALRARGRDARDLPGRRRRVPRDPGRVLEGGTSGRRRPLRGRAPERRTSSAATRWCR